MSRFAEVRTLSTAVGFAVILPVVFTVMFAVATAATYLGVSTSVQRLAVDVARTGLSGTYDWERNRAARKFLASNAADYFMVDPELLDANVATITSDAAGRIVVSVTYDASRMPIWSLAGILPMPDPVITRTAVVLGRR